MNYNTIYIEGLNKEMNIENVNLIKDKQEKLILLTTERLDIRTAYDYYLIATCPVGGNGKATVIDRGWDIKEGYKRYHRLSMALR